MNIKLREITDLIKLILYSNIGDMYDTDQVIVKRKMFPNQLEVKAKIKNDNTVDFLEKYLAMLSNKIRVNFNNLKLNQVGTMLDGSFSVELIPDQVLITEKEYLHYEKMLYIAEVKDNVIIRVKVGHGIDKNLKSKGYGQKAFLDSFVEIPNFNIFPSAYNEYRSISYNSLDNFITSRKNEILNELMGQGKAITIPTESIKVFVKKENEKAQLVYQS